MPLKNLSQPEVARLSSLLDHALDLAPELRETWLSDLSRRDPDIGAHVKEMLTAIDKVGDDDPLETRDLVGHRLAAAVRTQPTLEGRLFGPYRVLRLLGQGGMGSVWLAERADGLFSRQVALKLVHQSLMGGAALGERFARERAILAGLDHPRIARLLDAGVAEDGQPYLAIEYVEGTPLTAYCDAKRLALPARIDLVVQVLSAVQHAHRNLVVHRDLKPSNILVTAEGQVRLLDFGIAKLLTEGVARETELTQQGGRALTPEYASPEQIAGEPVTTASDVYSLGVLLYELLCGNRPYQLKRDSRGALEEAILTADPMRPSQSAIADAIATARSTTAKKLRQTLGGDLDTIVLKALKKNPAERYATADAFMQDLQRYGAGEPVTARPDSAVYRVRKFVWRNKFAAASAIAVFVALAAGMGVALWQARIARQQALIAKTEAGTAEAVQAFMEDIFRANSADQTDPLKAQQTTARELLDVGLKKIDTALADAPAAKLRVFVTLAHMYADLRLTQQAVDVYRKRVQLAQSLYGKTHPAVAEALIDLSSALFVSQHIDQRDEVLKEAAQILDQIGDHTSKVRAHLLEQQASLYYDRDSGRALELARRSVQLLRAFPPSQQLATALVTLGDMYGFHNEPERAETVLIEALSVFDQLREPYLSEMPQLYEFLADAQVDLQKFSAAEQSYRKGATAARKIGGEDHLDVIRADRSLGQFLFSTSRTKEGLVLMESAKVRILATRGDGDSLFTAWVLTALGRALIQVGRMEEALDDLAFAERNQRRYRPDGMVLALVLEREAEAQIELGRFDDARKSLAEAATIHLVAHGGGIQFNDHVRLRAHLSAVMGDGQGAQNELRQFQSEDGGPRDIKFTSIERDIAKAEAALASARFTDASSLAAYVVAKTERSGFTRYLRIYRAQAELIHGKALLLSGNPADAVLPLKDAVALMTEMYDSDRSPVLADAQVALADCYLDLAMSDEAKKLMAQAKAIHAAHHELGKQFKAPLIRVAARLAAL